MMIKQREHCAGVAEVNFLLFYLNHTKVLTCISCLQMCMTHWSLVKNCFSLPKREILSLLFLSSGSQPSMILLPGNIQQMSGDVVSQVGGKGRGLLASSG